MKELDEIKNLTLHDKPIIIPGFLRTRNPNLTDAQLIKLADDVNWQVSATDNFNDMKKFILDGGYGDGLKLDITSTYIYDIKVKAIGFSFKQRVRDRMRPFKNSVKTSYLSNVGQPDKLDKQLDSIDIQINNLEEKLTTIKPTSKRQVSTRNRINELRERSQRLYNEQLDIEDYLDELPYIDIPKSTGKYSERSTISQVANELRFPVKIHDEDECWRIVYRPDSTKHVKATAGRGGMMTWNINQWLATLPPLTPTKPPSDIVTGCTDSYFRTVINKSPYYCSYRRGLVTIYPACIKDGHVYLGTKPLAPAVGVCSADYLDMVLIPHGYDHKAVMGWSGSVSQGGVGV